MKTCSAVLTCEFVDEILWCDHSNQTSLAVLLHGTICFSILALKTLGRDKTRRVTDALLVMLYQIPLQASLLMFDLPQLNKYAVETFQSKYSMY